MSRPLSPWHIIRFAISVLVMVFAFSLTAEAKPNYTPVDFLAQTWETQITVSDLTPDMVSEWRRIHDLYPRWTPEPVAPPRSYLIARVYPDSVEQWRGLVEAHFSPSDVPWAMRVMNCESKGNPSAQNSRSSAGGLFQFINSTWAITPYAHLPKYDPEANIKAAAWLFYEDGPSHWVCK